MCTLLIIFTDSVGYSANSDGVNTTYAHSAEVVLTTALYLLFLYWLLGTEQCIKNNLVNKTIEILGMNETYTINDDGSVTSVNIAHYMYGAYQFSEGAAVVQVCIYQLNSTANKSTSQTFLVQLQHDTNLLL